MNLSILWDVIAFIVMFGLLVIFHEGGHYLIARANGIKVYEFTIGVGPKIIHFKVGETEFSVRALPFGGACIFENLDEADEEDEKKENEEKLVADLESDKKNKNFNDAPVFARIATVFSGYFFKQMKENKINKLLLIATGALMNSTTSQQGESIPSIAHAIAIENNI